MATTTTPSTRLTTAAAASLLTLGLLGYPLAVNAGFRAVAAILFFSAIAALAAGLLTRSHAAIATAIAAVGADYVLFLHAQHSRLSYTSALYGAALLVMSELAHWSTDTGTPSAAVQSTRDRSLATAAIGLAALAIGAAAIAVGRAFSRSGGWLEPLGFIAATALTLVCARVILTRRSDSYSLPRVGSLATKDSG